MPRWRPLTCGTQHRCSTAPPRKLHGWVAPRNWRPRSAVRGTLCACRLPASEKTGSTISCGSRSAAYPPQHRGPWAPNTSWAFHSECGSALGDGDTLDGIPGCGTPGAACHDARPADSDVLCAIPPRAATPFENRPSVDGRLYRERGRAARAPGVSGQTWMGETRRTHGHTTCVGLTAACLWAPVRPSVRPSIHMAMCALCDRCAQRVAATARVVRRCVGFTATATAMATSRELHYMQPRQWLPLDRLVARAPLHVCVCQLSCACTSHGTAMVPAPCRRTCACCFQGTAWARSTLTCLSL
ncbi:hypothetical protein HYPSUDRAFT_88600 [Hypholoma sublateritium FD-334 SS-4]|uniref:Uncharacterized protein n=1 Tax=Hypholoma sublateritium (strain FD-334 SS-4) TaxID=945553 RepID=A0A0D2NPC8_HYPSF|nr:hypothetical protein HYPSUDRAFT_88600 [Hypholoma sublateritium FD-334 SS-4]